MSTILLSCSFPKSSNENKPNNENVKQGIEKAEKILSSTDSAKQLLLMGSFIQYGKNKEAEAGNMYGIEEVPPTNQNRLPDKINYLVLFTG